MTSWETKRKRMKMKNISKKKEADGLSRRSNGSLMG